MAHLTIFILVLVAVGISETFSRSVFSPEVSIGAIKEMSDRGRDGHQSFKCPATPGRYPDPENCENYYECQRGYATLKHCHRGKLFDSKRHECRDKRDVKCETKRRKDSDEDTSEDRSNESREAEQSFKCPSYSGRYPDPKNCEKYYECKERRPTLKHCQRGNFYDSGRGECRDKRYVKCDVDQDKDSDEDKSEDKSNESKESHQLFKCPTTSGRYPDPKNCEKYFECKKGYSTLKHCHRGKLFDSKRHECRDKRDVKCDIERERDSDEDKSEEEVTEKDFKCPHTYGSFAHPKDCSKYFVCLNKRPKLYQCNKYFLYDEKIGKCLPREKVNCGKRLDREDLRSSTAKTIPYTKPQTRTTTSSTTVSTLTPTTMKQVPTTISTSESEATTTSLSKGTTLAPTTLAPTTTTLVPNTVTTLAPTTTTTLAPTTLSSTTTSLAPNTVTTLAPTTTTTSAPTTLAETTITTTTAVPTTTTSTLSPTTTTQNPTSSSVAGDTTETELPATKPNTPPPTDCDKDDLDCIIDGTGDVTGWFDCPKQYGHFPHGGSTQLFIHCDNWKPHVKKCAANTYFSPEYLVCVW